MNLVGITDLALLGAGQCSAVQSPEMAVQSGKPAEDGEDR